MRAFILFRPFFYLVSYTGFSFFVEEGKFDAFLLIASAGTVSIFSFFWMIFSLF
jgi:hypothetical protein